MSRIITFSRSFPSYHPKKGEPTYFVEKFWRSIEVPIPCSVHADQLEQEMRTLLFEEKLGLKLLPKHHTIRQGNRWKVGDKFSPRVWSGKPYKSKMIIIADDVEIKNVWDFEIKPAYQMLPLDYDTDIIINHRFYHSDDEIMKRLAQNDGLSLAELLQWFKYPEPFKGQIICWGKEIEY